MSQKKGGSGIQGGAWAGAIAFPLATLANALMLYLEGSRPSQIVMGAWLMLSMIAPFLGAMPGAFLGLIFAFCADIIAAQRRLNARRRSGRVLRPLQPIEPEMSVETHAHADGSGPTNV